MATYPSSLGTTTPIGNSLLSIRATTTDSILATLRAFAGQIANLFQIQDSSGSNLFSINASGGALFSNGFTLGSLNGPLQANNGSVSATSSIGVLFGGTGLTSAPAYGNLLVGNSGGGYTLTATSSLGLGGSSGTVTSVGLTAPTGLTVTGSPITTSGTLGLSLTSGYNIPLTASTTEYDTAYSNRITSASSPLSITNHAISLSTAGDWTGTFDSQEGSYYLDARNLSNFGTPFYTFFNSTTTDALTQGSTNKYYSTNLFAGNLAGTTTTALAEGNNLYFTNTRFDNRLSATTTLPNLTTLANLVTTGALTSGSIGSGFGNINIGSNTFTGNGSGLTALNANNLTNFGTPFYTYFSATTTDALAQGSTNKYYSTNLFAGSLAGTTTTALAEGTNLYYTSNRVASVIAGTTTTAVAEGNNLYFTNARSDSRFITDLAATSSVASITTLANLVSTGALTSGSIGSSFGNINIGSNTFTGNGSGLTSLNASNLTNFGGPFYTFLNATTTDALSQGTTNKYYSDTSVNSYINASSTISKTYTINTFTGANTFNGGLTLDTFNGPLQANAGVVSATTSIGVLYGGTGSTTLSGILIGNGTSQVQTLTIGNGLTLTGTTLSAAGGSGITALGPTGQTQTGATITLATSTSVTNGLTSAVTIVGSGNTLTFTPSLSGTLSVGGGGTGATTFNQGWLFSSGDGNAFSASTSPTVNYITATSTTATSTFAHDINITGGCFAKNGACIGITSDLQTATSFLDTDVSLSTSATSTLTTVSVTPSTATGDVSVQAEVSIRSASNTDGSAVIAIRKTDCTGTILAQLTEIITEASAGGSSSLFLTAIDVDVGASSQTYALCGSAVTQGHTATVYSLSATVIDTGSDLAEIYTTSDAGMEAGDVVSYDFTLKTGVKKSAHAYDHNVVGIVSTKPGMVIGGVSKEGVKALPVALSGRVPVKVVTENGAIKPGDYLTPSSVPGVAMSAKGFGPVIGQAMSAYEGEDVGMILVLVKNFDLGAVGEVAVLMGDISPKINADGSDNGLSTLVATIQSETAHDPIAIITKKINDGKQFLTDFVVSRITAIRGYFDEVFANKTHQKTLCVGEVGNETCVTKDQLDNLLSGQNVAPATSNNLAPANNPEPTSSSTPSVVVEPIPLPSPDATVSTATETATVTPPTLPEVTAPVVVEPTPIPVEPTITPEPTPTVEQLPATPTPEASQ